MKTYQKPKYPYIIGYKGEKLNGRCKYYQVFQVPEKKIIAVNLAKLIFRKFSKNKRQVFWFENTKCVAESKF